MRFGRSQAQTIARREIDATLLLSGGSFSSREYLPIANFPRIFVILEPPGLFAGLAGRSLELQFLLRFLRVLLRDSEFVVIEDPQCFHGVRDGDAAVPDEEQILTVGTIRG